MSFPESGHGSFQGKGGFRLLQNIPTITVSDGGTNSAVDVFTWTSATHPSRKHPCEFKGFCSPGSSTADPTRIVTTPRMSSPSRRSWILVANGGSLVMNAVVSRLFRRHAQLRLHPDYHSRETSVVPATPGQLIALALFLACVTPLRTEAQSTLVLRSQPQSTLILFRYYTGGYTGLAFSPDGKHLVVGTDGWDISTRRYLDGEVKVWDMQKERECLSIKAHPLAVTCVAFSPDGKRIASGSLDRIVKVWDAATGKELLTLKGHSSQISNVVFSPSRQRLLSSSTDLALKVWDTEKGTELLTLQGHTDLIRSAVYSPDGKRIASSSSDETVRVWDAETGQELLVLNDHSGGVIRVAFSPDGMSLASIGADRTLRVRDAVKGRENIRIPMERDATCMAYSPDGKQIAVGYSDSSLRIWQVDTGKEVFIRKGRGAVRCIAYSPDGKVIATAAGMYKISSELRLWDVSLGPVWPSFPSLMPGR